MHTALLIDEILREIFEICGQDRSTLCQIVRCCRAWKDPALDRLWRKLSAVEPLLALVTDIELDGIYVPLHAQRSSDLAKFRPYANRVKHITLRQNTRVHPDVLRLLCHATSTSVLPNLAVVQISSTGCHSLLPLLCLSSNVRRVEVELGFKSGSGGQPPICDYLERIAAVAPAIELVRLRGLMCERMNRNVSCMTSLHSLSLRTGSSLTTETLAAVAAFPFLTDLDVQAGHIPGDDFSYALGSYKTSLFPSLRKLRVRAYSPLVECLLQVAGSGLRVLRIELEDHASPPVPWSTIFALIRARASQTLQDLTIEHHIDIDSIDDTPGTPPTSMSIQAPNQHLRINDGIIIDTLRPLADVRFIRRFILDTSIPPDLHDHDLEQMSKWWPSLTYLDLGSLPVLEIIAKDWKPRVTLAGLATFPKLESLILPLDLTCATQTLPTFPVICQNTLHRLTISSTTPPDHLLVAQSLHRLFPFLREIDGTGEHEAHWQKVRSTVDGLFRTLQLLEV